MTVFTYILNKHNNMNEYQKRDFDNLTAFAATLSEFYPARVVAHDDNFIVVLTRGDKEYNIRKNYDETVDVWEHPHRYYPHVSSSTRGELYKKYKTQNMKAITRKKLDVKLDACDAYQTDAQAVENKANATRADFIATLDASGLPVRYQRKDYKDVTSEITGGEIIKKGISYTFTFHDDGYISQKVATHYSIPNSLECFIALSENNYKPKND